ncbi:M91 family zinc metallopeptidase, partial [Olavius algarvensis spirochete endosymbiont]|uniref:M91 family zinc metallopeptidase n=1 Tax=Olavius algarvensis spirochete endosymbiont TaxID=260710 RepID=UPI0011CEB057
MKIRIKGSRAFRKKVRKALRKIRSKPEGKKLVKNLRKSKNKHVIRERPDDLNSNATQPDSSDGYEKSPDTPGSGSGSTILFDPDDPIGGKNSEGKRER